MPELIKINKKPQEIDSSYFDNYGGAGDYSDSYEKFTITAPKIISELLDSNISFNSILDVGCASGELVRDLRMYGYEAYGIENNEYILKRSVAPQYTYLMDLRNLQNLRNNCVDIIFTNSLMYIYPQEVKGILKEFHRTCKKAVYLCIPFLSPLVKINEDPFRTFLAKEIWWEEQFKQVGFKKVTESIYSK